MRSDQEGIDAKRDVNGREGMFLIRRSGKAIYGIFRSQRNIWLRVEVDDIEGRGAYCRSQFKGGTGLIPSDWHQEGQGKDHVRVEHIRGQGVRKEEEGMGMSGGYRRQWNPIKNGLFTETGKSPTSVFCDHLSDKSGTLSSLVRVYKIPSL